MELNKKGFAAYDRWHNIYCIENDALGGNSENGDFVEGWCIVDNYHYIKTLADECELLIYGYGCSAISHLEEYIDQYGEEDFYFTDPSGKNYTAKETLNKLLEYFC